MNLCHTFKSLAERTWTRLERASAHGLLMGEESITDDLLLELKERHPHQITIRQFNKAQERTRGADWEWWLNDGGLWFGMLVQAKRLLVQPITRRSKDRVKVFFRKSQHLALITTAARKQICPVYVFYCQIPEPFRRHLNWQYQSDDDLKAFGCTFSDAYALPSIMVSPTLSCVSSRTLSWTDLVCPDSSAKLPSRLPDQLFQILSAKREETRFIEAENAPFIDYSIPTVPEPKREAPTYVHIAMKADNEVDLRRAAKLAYPTKGIMIVKDASTD